MLTRSQLSSAALTLLLVLLTATSALAQAILSGRALDGATRQGLPFASVVLETGDPTGKLVQAAVTDKQGYFSLPAVKPGSYQLQVLQLGFTTLTQPVQVAAGSASLKLGVLALVPSAQGLGEVVVSGRKPLLEQRPDRVTMHVAGSLLATGNSAYEVLAAAPAVQLIEGQPLRLRGKAGVVLYLNGKRLPSGTSLETLLAGIPGDQLDRIELISNTSAKYDADAAGGVIEIYTKKAAGLGWTGNVGANVRQGHRTGGGLTGGLQASTAKWAVAASGGYSRRGGFERSTGSRQFGTTTVPAASLTQASDLNKVLTDGSFSGSVNYQPGKQATLGLSVDAQAGSLVGAGWAIAALSQPQGRTSSQVQEDVTLRENFTNTNLFYRQELDTLHSSFLLSST